MTAMTRYILAIGLPLFLAGFTANNGQELNGLQIAFVADVHLQRVYGNFSDTGVDICIHPLNNQNVTIRTMQAQLNSTRLFNENYFVFLAVLDDLVRRGVKHVVLPGDFSDNGQPLGVNAVREILDHYAGTHGMEFFLTTGNHDPSRPYLADGGHPDYMGEGGRRQPVYSRAGLYTPGSEHELPVVITKDVKCLGYREITAIMADYGFFPRPQYIYWETPFSTYDQGNYFYYNALEEASLENRMYIINPNSMTVPDASYLVEPVEGLWLLAIDANVYIPRARVSSNNEDPSNYAGSSVGYNEVITHKAHLVDWVQSVAERAEAGGKTLIAFSHYPLVDYTNDASPLIRKLFGDNRLQMHRVPSETVARVFADAGIQVHFGSHMHLNDTGIRESTGGRPLFNIQVPSLGGYIPAYKILTIKSGHLLEVETVVVDSVPRFNELFDLYRIEYDYLSSSGDPGIWDIEILSSANYHEFTAWHLRELARLRFLPNDWPPDLRQLLAGATGWDIITISQLEDPVFFGLDQEWFDRRLTHHAGEWRDAEVSATHAAAENNMTITEFGHWGGFDLVCDYHRLMNADKLAFRDIGEERLRHYSLLAELFGKRFNDPDKADGSESGTGLSESLATLFEIDFPPGIYIVSATGAGFHAARKVVIR